MLEELNQAVIRIWKEKAPFKMVESYNIPKDSTIFTCAADIPKKNPNIEKVAEKLVNQMIEIAVKRSGSRESIFILYDHELDEVSDILHSDSKYVTYITVDKKGQTAWFSINVACMAGLMHYEYKSVNGIDKSKK